MNIRKFVATGLAVFAALWFFGHCTACSAPLSDADKAHVAGDGIMISTCAASAHLCKRFEQTNAPDASLSKCWDEYDECLAGHGFRDASLPVRTLNFANDNDGGR